MEKVKWGFDLTDFGSDEKFKKVLKKLDLKKYRKKKKVVHYDQGQKISGGTFWTHEKPYHTEYYNYEWSSPDVKIVTGNNPLTGLYTEPKRRPRQKGYASYIGIEGEKAKVMKLKEEIRKQAKFIKDESKFERDFI